MHLIPQTKFEYTGIFEGFVRNPEGKKRLMLTLLNDTQLEFKMEKEMRKEWEDRLDPGALVTVTGYEHFRLLREAKRIIKRIKVLAGGRRKPEESGKCTIEICGKKNCWRSGGKELMDLVKARLGAAGLEDGVQVRAVSCLDECKRAPNMKVGKHVHTRCSPATVDKVIASVSERLREQVR